MATKELLDDLVSALVGEPMLGSEVVEAEAMYDRNEVGLTLQNEGSVVIAVVWECADVPDEEDDGDG